MKNFGPSMILILAAMSFPSLHATNVATPSAQFQISEKTQVPGHTLKPGSYSLQVVDHLSDRMVLRITSDSGKEESTFLAVPPTAAFPSQPGPGPVDMRAKGGHVAALRGFVFPDGTRSEFVYLKAEAVPLAKANNTTLVAIDPSSEGRPDKSNLSASDRQLVTLWMLTPTTIGKTPAIEAQRYQLAANTRPEPPQDWSVPSSRTARPARTVLASNSAPAPHRVANPPAVLPHTGSSQPLILAFASFFLCAALFFGYRRRGLERTR